MPIYILHSQLSAKIFLSFTAVLLFSSLILSACLKPHSENIQQVSIKSSIESGHTRSEQSALLTKTMAIKTEPTQTKQTKQTDLFLGKISKINKKLQKQMLHRSWHPNCPIPFSKLRQVDVTFWNHQQMIKKGTLIVHQSIAQKIHDIFKELFKLKYPFSQIKAAWEFDGDDSASMQINNTSAFNCRPKTGYSKGFSRHSYGFAIDINPQINPYISRNRKKVLPKNAKDYMDRTQKHPMLLKNTGAVVKLFKKYGFTWGGNWRSVKDYQHFEFSQK